MKTTFSILILLTIAAFNLEASIKETSITQAKDYILKGMGNDGKFTYLAHLDPAFKIKNRYNVLRHFGTIYSLNMAEEYKPGSVSPSKLKKSIEFIINKTFEPIKGTNLMGVWSTKELSGSRRMTKRVKLGAAGLALVALSTNQKKFPDLIKLNDLKKIADFILYMQKKDGSFYSFYFENGGRSDKQVSLYYPGEAAFGLTEMYKLTKDRKYFDSAVRCLLYLSRSRKNQSLNKIPADHWALIATSKIFKLGVKLDKKEAQEIISHGERVSRSILLSHIKEHKNPDFIGAFGFDARTTPAATRLEGLLAFYPNVQDQKLKEEIKKTIVRGVGLLKRAQVKTGFHQGAWTRGVSKMESGVSRNFNRRVFEIRIDYVQHALSALIGFKSI